MVEDKVRELLLAYVLRLEKTFRLPRCNFRAENTEAVLKFCQLSDDLVQQVEHAAVGDFYTAEPLRNRIRLAQRTPVDTEEAEETISYY